MYEPTTICDYCEEEFSQITEYEIHFPIGKKTHQLCDDCLKYVVEEYGYYYRIVGKTWQ